MDLIQRIHQVLQPLHQAIEALPLSQAIVQGRVSRPAYCRLLEQLLSVHATLEEGLFLSPWARDLFRPNMARVGALENDLAALGGAAAEPPLPPTEQLVRTLVSWRWSASWRLLGALYVVEGSRLGSMVLVRPLSEALGVPPELGHGLDYHLEGMTNRPLAWRKFKSALAAFPWSAAQESDITAAAAETMAGLVRIYAAIEPQGGTMLAPPLPEFDPAPALTAAR